MTPAPCYRIIRHRAARGEWFEVIGLTAADGRPYGIACDDWYEARQLVRRLEAEAARPATRPGVVPRVVAGEFWYDVRDDDGTYLATVATVAEAEEYLNEAARPATQAETDAATAAELAAARAAADRLQGTRRAVVSTAGLAAWSAVRSMNAAGGPISAARSRAAARLRSALEAYRAADDAADLTQKNNYPT